MPENPWYSLPVSRACCAVRSANDVLIFNSAAPSAKSEWSLRVCDCGGVSGECDLEESPTGMRRYRLVMLL